MIWGSNPDPDVSIIDMFVAELANAEMSSANTIANNAAMTSGFKRRISIPPMLQKIFRNGVRMLAQIQ